ncbi:MAG: hypothetical protein AB1941_19350 [Gemmatimonadota bacterium]
MENADDELVLDTVTLIRDGYGEADVLTALQPDEDVGMTFDLTAVTKAFRRGLPNPESDLEGKKKPHLTNYRSETLEFVARYALRVAHGINFPVHPQRGKLNVNQPVLGFDGWGIFESADDGFKLALIQVKGTDEDRVPPREATKLADECTRIPTSVDEVCRALSVMIVNLPVGPELYAIGAILESLADADELPPVLIAPVVVRGLQPASNDDLGPIRDVAAGIEPSGMRGLSVRIGVDLTAFGHTVMTRARAA